jgi:two-component system OmpR family sensor kinase
MFDSIRVRLTLWYTGFLALILIGFSFGTYFVLARITLRRTDAALTELGGAFRGAIQQELADHKDPNALRSAASETLQEFRLRDHLFAVFDSNQILLAASGPGVDSQSNAIFSAPPIRSLIAAGSKLDRAFDTVKIGAIRYRGYAMPLSSREPGAALVILQSLNREQNFLEDITQTFLWVVPMTVLLASAGSYFLARKSLAPVVSMSNRAGVIGAENLHERLPIRNARDELGQLAHAFNSLLERLDRSFEQLRQFMADASHELRSPVAIIRGEAEVALSKPSRPSEEYRESLVVVRDEARRLSRIVQDLFTLARADAGQYSLKSRQFYLDELIGECVRAAQSLAVAGRLALSYRFDEELLINADEELIRRMTMNLLDNAVKYTREGGSVTVECRRVDGQYALTVTDTGHGIPIDTQKRIFERFFRAENARSYSFAESAGAGLGLPIARWIAEAHHGKLELLRSDTTGSTFGVFLPVT